MHQPPKSFSIHLRILIGKQTFRKYPEKFRFSISFIQEGKSTSSTTYTAIATEETLLRWLGKILREAVKDIKVRPIRLALANARWIDEELHEARCERMSPEINLFVMQRVKRLQKIS